MTEKKKTSYIGGAAILAATVAITKVVGFVYKIPLYNLLGDEGTAHFSVTYTIYNLLLTISSAGIPVALSRLIAAANARDNRRQISQYFRIGLLGFSVIGVLCMLLMLLFPHQLAEFMGDPEVYTGIRALAPAVLFVCIISVYRGYAQGHGNMLPTAVSQIMEVSCKLIFGISIAWYLSSLGADTASISAGAIVGVTIGLGLSIPLMLIFKRRIDRKEGGELTGEPMSAGATLAEILKIGIPITISASILNIITLIDTKLVLLRLQTGSGFDYMTAKTLYGVYSKATTLFSMPSAFIVPVTMSVIPAISAALARDNRAEARDLMESSLKLTNLFALPAGVGLCVLSYPIFNVLYPRSNENGPTLLMLLGIASFFVCAQLITNAILQATGHERLALLTLPIGGLVKITVNWFLVGTESVNIIGAPIGTLCCYVLITAINLIFIRKRIADPPRILKTFLRPALCTLCMAATAILSYNVLYALLHRMAVAMAAAIILAVAVYAVCVILLRAVTREDLKLVPKGEKIAKVLKIR